MVHLKGSTNWPRPAKFPGKINYFCFFFPFYLVSTNSVRIQNSFCFVFFLSEDNKAKVSGVEF